MFLHWYYEIANPVRMVGTWLGAGCLLVFLGGCGVVLFQVALDNLLASYFPLFPILLRVVSVNQKKEIKRWVLLATWKQKEHSKQPPRTYRYSSLETPNTPQSFNFLAKGIMYWIERNNVDEQWAMYHLGSRFTSPAAHLPLLTKSKKPISPLYQLTDGSVSARPSLKAW